MDKLAGWVLLLRGRPYHQYPAAIPKNTPDLQPKSLGEKKYGPLPGNPPAALLPHAHIIRSFEERTAKGAKAPGMKLLQLRLTTAASVRRK